MGLDTAPAERERQEATRGQDQRAGYPGTLQCAVTELPSRELTTGSGAESQCIGPCSFMALGLPFRLKRPPVHRLWPGTVLLIVSPGRLPHVLVIAVALGSWGWWLGTTSGNAPRVGAHEVEERIRALARALPPGAASTSRTSTQGVGRTSAPTLRRP